MFGFGGKSFAPETDIPNLAGKVILITGGKSQSSMRTGL